MTLKTRIAVASGGDHHASGETDDVSRTNDAFRIMDAKCAYRRGLCIAREAGEQPWEEWRVMDGDERTGADVVREVIVALSPQELPFLESVFSSYRADPWTLEDDARVPADERVPWAPFAMGFVGQSIVGGLRAEGWLLSRGTAPVTPQSTMPKLTSAAPATHASRPAPPNAPRWRMRGPSRWIRRPRWEDLAEVPDLLLPALEERHLQRIWTDAVRAAAVKGRSTADREAFAAAVIAGLMISRPPLVSRTPGQRRP
ncbi:hypothetical protein AB0J80_21890 [Actinoplanes sp. NPDC049548]|uniref:hypothetical protein n=1 Tax=Actinoplanes sp. NPDC049548 TaxID=3155152 RepID=UPI0034441D61